MRALTLTALSLAALMAVLAPVSAQTLRAYRLAGDRAFDEQDYYAAISHYTEALRRSPDDPELLFRYAETAQRFHAFEEAGRHYRRAQAADKAGRLPLLPFRLGEVAKSLGRYEEAKAHFADYLAAAGPDAPLAPKARDEMEACDWAAALLAADPPPVRLERLGKAVNSPYGDFGAVQRGDTLYFSTHRFEYAKDDRRPRRRLSKIMIYTGGRSARALPPAFNTPNRLAAHTAFSGDGRRLYFTLCDYTNTTKIRCELYYADRDRRGRWPKQPVRMPPTLNITNYTATHPAIGYDSTLKAEVLYFASDRPGGMGGMDIWRVAVPADGRSFPMPENLGGANTSADDLSPWFHSPTQTLYFSTDGRPSMGGFDIYRLGPDDAAPVHLGLPFNSSFHDLHFSLADDGLSGLLASNRPGSSLLDAKLKTCCHDIYRFDFLPPSTEPEPDIPPTDTPSLAGTPTPKSDDGPLPTRLEDFLPLALYFDNDEPDRRTRRTTTRKSYTDTYARYARRQEEYRREYARPLPPDSRPDAEAEIDDFFDNALRRGHDFLGLFSDILLQRLQNGETVEIFIKGFTSPRAQSDYNLLLGQRRVSSVRNHFDTYADAVFRPFLRSGQLRISERSFGDTTADAAVSADLDDLRNSVYHPAAARERRVEIVEVKVEAGGE